MLTTSILAIVKFRFNKETYGGELKINKNRLPRKLVSYLVNIYLFKVNNRNTRKTCEICEICSKLTIKKPERRH